jgi:hypothetical protein
MKIKYKFHIDHAKNMLVACSVALLVAACGGGSDSVTAVAPATETTGNQLATSVDITGYDSLSLAQLSTTTNGTQTAMLPRLLNWLSDALVLTGRDLGDPDLKKVIIDIDAAGALTTRPATNTSLQPVSIVKL